MKYASVSNAAITFAPEKQVYLIKRKIVLLTKFVVKCSVFWGLPSGKNETDHDRN
jgi:hypothetical protein